MFFRILSFLGLCASVLGLNWLFGSIAKLIFKLGDNALMGWGDGLIGRWLGVTSPTEQVGLGFLLEWSPPIVLTLLAWWLLYRMGRARAVHKPVGPGGPLETRAGSGSSEPRETSDIEAYIEELDQLAADLGELQGDYPLPMQTDPKFKDEAEWRRAYANSQDDMLREYFSKYSVKVQRAGVIGMDKGICENTDVWKVSHLFGAHELSEHIKFIQKISIGLRYGPPPASGKHEPS